MPYVLVIFTVTCLISPCQILSEKVIVSADSKEQCETAREELLKVPGYLRDWVKCIPGKSPTTGTSSQ